MNTTVGSSCKMRRWLHTLALAVGSCVAGAANAAAGSLTVGDASEYTRSTPVSMLFPVSRDGDAGYDVVLAYHTTDGTAVAGLDYTATAGTLFLPAAMASASIPVEIASRSVPATDLAFQLQVGPAAGIGPAPVLTDRQPFGSGTFPRWVATADINNDGKLDLIVASESGNAVSVRLNTTPPGATIASFAAPFTFATGAFGVAVAAVDINGDGRPDLIVTNYSDYTVSVLLNATPPGALIPVFAMQHTFATGHGPRGVSVGDVNRDGLPDLIVANYSEATVSVLLNTTAPGAITPSFADQQTFATGLAPYAAAAIDVNGDGAPDLAVANAGSGTVSVLMNVAAPGSSTAAFADQVTFTTGAFPRSITAADLNGDGLPDLAVGNANDNTVSVLINTMTPGAAAPTFAMQQPFASGSYPIAVAAADLNGDGKPDLLVANNGDDTLLILRNTTGPGSTVPAFDAQPPLAAGAGPLFVSAADFNGDGKEDVVVANRDADTVSVFLDTTPTGAATAAFAMQQTFAGGAFARSIAAADINGDGKPDVIVGNANDNSVSVLLDTTAPGATAPSFAAEQPFATGAYPIAVTAADIDGDGRPDVIVANNTDDNVSVLLNRTAPGDATPAFALQQTFGTGASPLHVAAADLNGDGRPDLIVVNRLDNNVAVLLNTTPPGAATASFAAPHTFAAGTFPRWVAIADINGDGRFDLIVASESGNAVSVLLNTTPPGGPIPAFAMEQTFATGAFGVAVAAADVNGDGRPDLIVTNYSDYTVSVLLNTTPPGALIPSFAMQHTFATGHGPRGASVADVNGDGLPDLVVANYSDATVSVLLNTTAPGAVTPSFADQQTFETGFLPYAGIAVDINGDGSPDLLVVDAFGDSVSALLNTRYLVTVTPAAATGTIVHDYIFADGFE